MAESRRGQGRLFPQSFLKQRGWPCQHLDFGGMRPYLSVFKAALSVVSCYDNFQGKKTQWTIIIIWLKGSLNTRMISCTSDTLLVFCGPLGAWKESSLVCRITDFIWIILFFFFFFWSHPRHAEVPGPGIEPMPQQGQHQILNPLSHQGTPGIILFVTSWKQDREYLQPGH